MKSWLKGGLVGAGVGLIVTFISWIFIIPFFRLPSAFVFILRILYIFMLVISSILYEVLGDKEMLLSILTLVITIIALFIVYFILGALIGLIIGKIKNAKGLIKT